MTVLDLGAQALRLWWLTLAGLLLTAAAGYQAVTVPGVYWSHVDVVFLRPAAVSPNTLGQSSARVIEAASVIQREVTGVERTRVVSDGVTIVDEGIIPGVEVRLPNAGGQWANNFNRPFLRVEVSDRTARGAQARLTEILARIERSLSDRQQSAGVAPENRLTIMLNPAAPKVEYSAGLPVRAAVAVAVLGLGLTGAALVLTSRKASRKKGKHDSLQPRRRLSASQYPVSSLVNAGDSRV